MDLFPQGLEQEKNKIIKGQPMNIEQQQKHNQTWINCLKEKNKLQPSSVLQNTLLLQWYHL